MSIAPLLIILVLAIVLLAVWRQWRKGVRADYIRTYPFPPTLYEKLRQKRPNLSDKECQLVGRALRQFFLAYLQSGCRFVSMPSQITDDLWHEFILYTRHYQLFCRKAFGGFLHHTPAVVLGKNKQNNSGLRRIWWFSCREENINPRRATRLPLLFAVDGKLNIPDGFYYSADCQAFQKNAGGQSQQGAVYCGGDFSSSSFDGCTDGFGDSTYGDSSDGGDGGSDGGCSDGGCSGGCGGD